MMDFSHYEHASMLPSPEQIRAAEVSLEMNFGTETREYLSRYGYLAGGGVRFYGLNEGGEFDMLTATHSIRKAAGWTWGYVLVERLGDSRYAMADKSDRIYIADMVKSGFHTTHQCLGEYMSGRFSGGEVLPA